MERKSSSKTRKDKEQKVLKEDHELNSSMAQTEPEQGRELTEEGDSSSSNLINRGKIKSIRKRKSGNLPDEDVIDGFLILSYGSLEELEADGPIKPGATIAKKARSSSPLLSVKKGKAKSLGKIKKNGIQEKNRKNKENTRDSILEADEKPKKKTRKIKLENATAAKPEQAAIEVDSPDPERKKDVAVSPLHVSEITEEPPAPLPTSSPSVNVSVEQKAKVAKLFEKVTRPEETPKVLKTITPKKTLSDFSIRAIQGIDTTPSSDSATKSIATMTLENSHDKSVSPPKVSDRVPLSSSQFYKGQERKISSTGNMIASPSKQGFPFPEKPRETGNGGQFPRLKFTPSVSSGSLHKIPHLQGDDLADVRQDKRSAPALSPDLLRQETHQHQHQHIHQHQHQHQHFHPPYGSMPGHPYGPMYYGPVSMMPVVPPSNHQGVPLHPIKKTGKWCALHVQIARFIAETQKKIEKFSIHKPDPTPSLTPSNRTGSHAFQAVQPRSHGHQERDLGHHFGGHFHSGLNTLPNQHHSSPLHSFTARPPEKPGLLSHPIDPGHHISSALRHGSSSRGPDLPSFGFSGLSRPFDRVPEHDAIADRLSPFSRRPRLADLGLPPTADFVGLGRSSSQSSLFLRRDTDAKLERERSHHITQSFLDREKPSLFRSSTFDLLDRPSDLRPGTQSLGHSLPGSELKNMGSPPLSKAVTTTQNILRSMKLYEKNFADRPADHQGLFHKEKTRDLGLFGSRPRIGGALGHSALIPNFGLGSARPHLPSS